MKTSYIKMAFAGMVLILSGGCKKFLDVNTNPNNATTTNAKFVFTGALGNSYRNQVSSALLITPGTWTGMYAHSTSFTGGGNEKQYAITNQDFNAFDGLFDNIADYQYVRDHADADGSPQWKDPSNIMQCYMFSMLVDVYGNIPYSQAFRGVANIAPKYDKDQDVYEDLVKRLDTAMTNIKAAVWSTAADVVNQDVMFQGNKDKWVRFANTLKLRILMRQAFIPGRAAYITTNINNTVANNYITDNVLISPGYQNVSGKLNTFYANYGYNEIGAIQSNNSYRKINAVLINFLKNTLDTVRLQSLAWPIGSGSGIVTPGATFASYVGIPLGIGSGFATASSSAIGPFQVLFGQGTRSGQVMLSSEALLLQAEAALRYGITFGSTPKALYEAGVLAHFRACAAPSTLTGATTNDALATRYLARPITIPGYAAGINAFNPNWDASPDQLRTILVERWLQYTHISGESAWSDYRASNGSPSSSVPYSVRTVATTSNPEPVRYLIPQTEENVNGNNTPKGISVFTSKIFWDVN
jgi:hypothetical protein